MIFNAYSMNVNELCSLIDNRLCNGETYKHPVEEISELVGYLEKKLLEADRDLKLFDTFSWSADEVTSAVVATAYYEFGISIPEEPCEEYFEDEDDLLRAWEAYRAEVEKVVETLRKTVSEIKEKYYL